MGSKQGSIEMLILSITILMTIIILTILFLLYIQINTCIYNIKSDLFYIAQNAYIATNYDELAYASYQINNELLEEKLGYLLKLNHPDYNFIFNEIKYDYISKKVIINIDLLVKPIVLTNMIGNLNINIKDNIKLKLMEVK